MNVHLIMQKLIPKLIIKGNFMSAETSFRSEVPPACVAKECPMPESVATGKLCRGQKVVASIKDAFSTLATRISNIFKSVVEGIKAAPAKIKENLQSCL